MDLLLIILMAQRDKQLPIPFKVFGIRQSLGQPPRHTTPLSSLHQKHSIDNGTNHGVTRSAATLPGQAAFQPNFE
jgi:hypothetical protein